MNLLLDTHAFLWFIGGGGGLSKKALSAIKNPDNMVFVSSVTAWEITIKHGLGKLDFPPNKFNSEMEAHYFTDLSITSEHAVAVSSLKNIHRDPFDRMLIAQAQIENLTIVTRDKQIFAYSIRCIEA